jgi:hypothetical protein
MWNGDIGDDPASIENLLSKLADASDVEARIALVDRPGVPLEVLLFLVEDESPDVRYAIAENHNVHVTVLQRLMDDDNPYVAHRARKTILRLGVGVVSTS